MPMFGEETGRDIVVAAKRNRERYQNEANKILGRAKERAKVVDHRLSTLEAERELLDRVIDHT